MCFIDDKPAAIQNENAYLDCVQMPKSGFSLRFKAKFTPSSYTDESHRLFAYRILYPAAAVAAI